MLQHATTLCTTSSRITHHGAAAIVHKMQQHVIIRALDRDSYVADVVLEHHIIKAMQRAFGL